MIRVMTLRVLACVGLFGSTLVAQNRSPLDLANAPVSPGAQRVVYGAGTQQFGELRLPSIKPPYPVATLHGPPTFWERWQMNTNWISVA